jgi:hypothetical protein
MQYKKRAPEGVAVDRTNVSDALEIAVNKYLDSPARELVQERVLF